LTLLLPALLAALPLPPVAPVPAWVTPVAVPEVPADADGAALLLVRDQQLLAGKTLESFERRVWKVRTLSGVEALAQHELEWDPASESLTLHGVWVWRDGVRRQAWHPDDAHVIQREAQLSEGIYDGRLTMRVELRDLRAGDVLELAYTTSGENPVFQGHFSMAAAQTAGEAATLSSFRLLWQRPRELAWKTYGGATPPTVAGKEGARVFSWALHDLKPPKFELAAPADVDQLPYVEFSDWRSWQEVDDWAQQLFTTPRPDARFQAELARFKALPEADRARAIVRFVQDDVRYVGIELGAHSHQPHSPAWVLERGFGDCKDKTLLLVSLLRGVGLQAWPALVHSHLGLRLPAALPSATHFNHAIARVDFPGGPRFVDATQTQRRGDPAAWEAPPFGHALVVRPGTAALEALPDPSSAAPTWEVRQRWSVPSPTGPATLEVETVASGDQAARLRSAVSSSTRSELTERRQADREETLAAKLVPIGLEWSDDEAAERFTLKEKYRVDRFFDDDQRHEFNVLTLGDLLPNPPEGPRTLPFVNEHPVLMRETITYDAPESLAGGDFELENRTISHPAFALAVKQAVTGSRLSMEWTFASHADRVAPAELDSYRVAVKDARRSLGYEVRRGSSSGFREPRSDPPWGLAVVGVVALVAWLVIANRPAPTVDKPSWRARFKQWRFRAKQKGEPGELPATPLVLDRAADAQRYFKSRCCPVGHAWPEGVSVLETVRLGDERISVVGRRCETCGASEHRYAKLRGD